MALLAGGALYYADTRTILLTAAAAYACSAVFAYRYLRRSLYRRVDPLIGPEGS